MSVTSLIPMIREHDKTRCTLPLEHTKIIDMPIDIFSEIYQNGQMSCYGRSKTTTPLLIEFIQESMAGRLCVTYLEKIGHISFHTRDGSVNLSTPLVIARMVMAGLGR